MAELVNPLEPLRLLAERAAQYARLALLARLTYLILLADILFSDASEEEKARRAAAAERLCWRLEADPALIVDSYTLKVVRESYWTLYSTYGGFARFFKAYARATGERWALEGASNMRTLARASLAVGEAAEALAEIAAAACMVWNPFRDPIRAEWDARALLGPSAERLLEERAREELAQSLSLRARRGLPIDPECAARLAEYARYGANISLVDDWLWEARKRLLEAAQRDLERGGLELPRVARELAETLATAARLTRPPRETLKAALERASDLFEAASPWAEEHARRAQQALEQLHALNPPERLRELAGEAERVAEELERRLGGRAVS
jgi:hypothetical protein